MKESPTEPNFGPDLARALQRALTAGSEELYTVLQARRTEVLRAALKNPALGEKHLLALLRRRDLAEDLLGPVSRIDAVKESHRLKVAIVYHPQAPGPLVQSLLPQLYLFELANLCYLPGVTPDQKLAAERAIIQRLPQVELGNKLTLARRATSNVVAAILSEGDARLMQPCLTNPRLKEAAVLQFINGGKSNAETISAIARHPKWRNRPNLRLAILKNPRTPAVWHTLLLPRLQSHEIRSLLASRRLTARQKVAIRDELRRRGAE